MRGRATRWVCPDGVDCRCPRSWPPSSFLALHGIDVVQILLNIVGPVFLIGVVGFVWARRGLPFDTDQVGSLVTNLATPCLVFDTLTSMSLSPSSFGALLLASILCHVAFFVFGWGILKAAKQPLSAYLPSVIFSNAGNMGLPLCLFAFGQQGLSFAVTYFLVNAVLLFTLSPQFASGKASFSTLPKTPVVWALAASLLFMSSGTPIPEWIKRPIHLLGEMMIPMMLLSLGVSLASLRINSLKIGAMLAVVRIGLGTLVGFVVAGMLGLDGIERGVVVLQSAMPVAGFTYLFAVRYRNHPDEVASMVVLSTALSFLTLPLLLSVLIF